MDQSEALKSSPSSRRRAPLLLGQRRNFLVSSDQWKPTLMTAGVALLLLVLVNVALYRASLRGTAEILADAPELASVIRSQDVAERMLIGVASLVCLAGVIVVGLLETHRTAGAAFNIRRQLGEIARGRLFARVRLRTGDNLRGLEAGFNEMAESLGRQARGDAEALRRLADEAESGADGALIASRLRELADRRAGTVVPTT